MSKPPIFLKSKEQAQEALRRLRERPPVSREEAVRSILVQNGKLPPQKPANAK
jgi:hypothetical protein